MGEKKKGIRKYVVNKTNEEFEGGMKQMWVGIKGRYWANKQEGQTRE